ncbi:2-OXOISOVALERATE DEHYDROGENASE SUBUNIT ALPHA 2 MITOCHONDRIAL [Salix koriyanagi]|uniref:2-OXOISOVALERATE DEHYDROGENASE SUBUNIT ALPHA 2 MITOCHONDRIAL n=1 Tax=Salix koriyanagi TaxID=2511006 RepID=A0A9Q0P7L8_9ROSI|nr:2-OXOISOVALERATE DEHYDROGENASE SUBUNIT ALPHA 2 MITOCHONDRIAL [Salix koriyanagi]
MAVCVRQSRNSIINHVKAKMGLLGLTCLSSSMPSLNNDHRTLSAASLAKDLRNQNSVLENKPILYRTRRFDSTKPHQRSGVQSNVANSQFLDFPGGKVAFTSEMRFISESPKERIPCYRVLDDDGQLIEGGINVGKEIAVKMYSDMATLQTMDTIFYDAQRQGRISFYLTTIGEEAINIASAAALTIDDFVVPQYREPGVLLWRGFTLEQFANQCFSNRGDDCRGRQMPIHYGSKKLNYLTVASTIASQLPHAVGVAYSLKMDGKDACAVTYFGDGGSSEGDFHAALNFAAVTEAPVLFICRNNGWAISTPTSDQFRSTLSFCQNMTI